MNTQNWDRMFVDLTNHEKVVAVEIDGDDLVVRLSGEAIRVTADREFARTVVWAPVMTVPGTALAAAAEAANMFNMEHCASVPTTMGLFVQKSTLLIGKSIPTGEPMDAGAIVGEALDLAGMLETARSFVGSVLEGRDGGAGPAVMPAMPAIRA